MAKEKIVYICDNCGNEFLKWEGKCSYCGQWNSLKEVKSTLVGPLQVKAGRPQIYKLSDIKIKNFKRIQTCIEEVDRVLGGGIVPSSVLLLAGEPGIGKSTLLLQIANRLSSLKNILYISGEESAAQLKMRCQRLKIAAKNLNILCETELAQILSSFEKFNPTLVIVDSIQAVYDSSFPSTAGSIVQVKECALRLQNLAKTTKTAVILVGHITKEGAIAGPKTLEHLVDVLLYLEGQRNAEGRILRSIKNRFGPTDEIGVFQMVEKGMKEVKNPSEVFLAQRLSNVAGSAVSATIEGTRAFLVEIQALSTKTYFGYPIRRASGFDLNRLLLLIAVLQKRLGLSLYNQDIFVNVVGGLKILEPAADLAVALAIVSALKNVPIPTNLCVFGEVGLSGEIRPVAYADKRAKEAKRLGFSQICKAKTLSEALKIFS